MPLFLQGTTSYYISRPACLSIGDTMEPGTIIAITEICFKLGRRIATGCKDWKYADAEVRERTTKVEFCWVQTRFRIEFMQRIARTLDEELIETIDKVLVLLASKLSLATSKLEKLWVNSEASDGTSTSKAKRTRYALTKSTLDEVVDDLEQWQRRFDPCWFLAMRIPNPIIDEQLRELNGEDAMKERKTDSEGLRTEGFMSSSASIQSPLSLAGGLRDALREDPAQQTSVFLPHDPYLEESNIPFTNAKYGQRGKGQSTKRFIIDSFTIPPQSDPFIAKKNARDLARKLSKADPATFRLLRCKGVLTINNGTGNHPTHYNFVYTLPVHFPAPVSLRQVLMDREDPLALSEKVVVAKDLANSVSYVHSFNFVHKGIRPENILLFKDQDSNIETFLVGFDSFRAVDGPTRKVGDQAWEKEIYRHPSRQGASPGTTYVMQHDIYSLGVCLLEVGLSTPFVNYSSNSPSPGPLYMEALGSLISLNERSRSDGPIHLSVSYPLKDHLVKLAKTRLPKCVGPKYASVVVTCLTCLDAENEDFGDERDMTDVDGILVGVRFIEKIISKLSEISL